MGMDVEVDIDDGLDGLEDRVSEELFKHAIRAQKRWQKNLERGRGETNARTSSGRRNTSWVNTGEGRDSITLEPQAAGSLSYRVGSDRVQVRVAEVGRSPTPGNPPPVKAITGSLEELDRWVREVINPPSEEAANVAFLVAMSIAENGIPPFHPGRNAARETAKELEESLDRVKKQAVEAL